jgi:hypothetical protein
VPAAEGHREIFGVPEARPVGNRRQRQVRLAEQLLHAAKPHPLDLLVRRVAEPAGKSALEHPPRGAERSRHVGHLDAIARMLPDMPHRRDDERIVDREHIGALAGGDPQGRQEPLRAVDPLVRHQPLEQFGGQTPRASRIGNHARQGRTRQPAEQFVIVDAEHRHLVRHRDPCPPAGVERLPAADVVAGKERHGLGQRLEPGLDRRLVVGGRAAPRLGEHRHLPATGGDRRDERLPTVVAPAKPSVPQEREVAKVAFEEVLGGQAGDRGIVGLDVGHVCQQPGGARIDHRNAEPAGEPLDGRRRGGRLDPRDHTVALPPRQPLERRRTAAVLRQEDGPGVVLPHVPVDARQEPAGIGIGGLDEDGDTGARTRGGHADF